MANIQKRPNGKWRARYRDLDGKEHARHFDRKLDAQRWIDEVTASIVTGQYVDPQAGRITFETYSKKWEESLIASEAGERITDNALRLHLVPALGSRAMAAIRRNDLQVLFKSLSELLGPGSVRNIYDVLVRLMTAAVEDKVIASSPCRRITLPPMQDEEVTPPTVAQVEAMARVMPPYIRAAIVTLAGSGLRIGELLGLKVSDVDFKAGTVRVERQRLQSGKIGAPKTAKSRRTVPVGEVVTDALLAHLAARPSKEWLFTMEEGEPLNYRRWKTEWNCARRTLQAAENEAAEREGRKPVALPHTVTHDLRHFYASALIAGGASVKQVQLVLGHASAVITLRIYAHLWPGEEDRTRTVMDAVLGGMRTGCGPVDQTTKEIAGQMA
ncbi:site-specific integrase [Streptomyces scabiei]|uniref:tyrosine-type recombinase/integrase n=1 Tax=Streptomyces TaxID=1883 RepID=UPI0007731EB4|nr:MULTISPECIES: site-specific integrase [Streptomyces]MDW8475799.1 site-specific integrase [Streptomyces scabiei]MDX2526114.1 site-specific integrase [Streptomyces europaeiscabiei]MDX2568521.1 site-specific integrase [Streptomyces scabiei]MDX3148513.1 site-specific integrase [Streptomyces scabiei]MDX3156554.1 site-specific integrase [Streptomyces scabiei]